jgi:hypothetical protein
MLTALNVFHFAMTLDAWITKKSANLKEQPIASVDFISCGEQNNQKKINKYFHPIQ